MVTRLVLVCAASLAGGCTLITDSFVTNDFSGDPFPVLVDTSTGAVIVGMREDGAADRTAVLDLLSPVTVIDPGPDAAPSVTTTDFDVLGADAPGGALARPRARLTSAQVISLHPCSTDECAVGPTGEQPIQAIVGADVLAGDAVRLRLGDSELFVLADVAGDEFHRSVMCDAVYPTPYRGGGTLVIGGSELDFGNRRITVQACLGADPVPTQPQGKRGADVLLVVSTGVGISILGESAYGRYVDAHPGAPALATLPSDSVVLASGAIDGHRATIPNLALVATSSATPRAPCREVYGHHLIAERDCVSGEDCPCEGGDTFCAIPGMVELSPAAGIDVLVVPDDNSTLQALRTELRPDQPEVDGILGTHAMHDVEIDADYPHDRLLARCSSPTGCVARPEINSVDDRPSVQACIGKNTGTIF